MQATSDWRKRYAPVNNSMCWKSCSYSGRNKILYPPIYHTARANYPQSHHHHGMMKWSVILFHIADGGLLIDEWMTESWIDVLSADEVRSKLIMKSTISLTARRKRCPTYVSYLFYSTHFFRHSTFFMEFFLQFLLHLIRDSCSRTEHILSQQQVWIVPANQKSFIIHNQEESVDEEEVRSSAVW